MPVSKPLGKPRNPATMRATGRSTRTFDPHDFTKTLFFSFFDLNRPAHRHRPAIDGSQHRRRWPLFNNLPQVDLGTGRWFVLHLCGCSSAGRARPRHGRGHEFETRHPLHFGCVLSLRCRVTWCWRRGMCATQGLSHVQRDTTSDGMLAFGHSRSGSPSPS